MMVSKCVQAIAFGMFLGGGLGLAQLPAAPPPATGQPRNPIAPPSNLKVLPKTTTTEQIIVLMREYRGDLGVNCEFCHEQDAVTKRNNFASDANPLKETARYMMSMTADLNDKYLAEMPSRRYADPITCGTCHRGEKHPSIFVPPARNPAPAAAAAPAAKP